MGGARPTGALGPTANGPESTSSAPVGRAPPMKKDLLWLTAVFGALCFFVLGRAALDPKDEGRYAEIPREMIAAGDYVTPRLDGITYFEKPPLVYWIEAGCQRLLGTGEFSVRAPAAAFCLIG